MHMTNRFSDVDGNKNKYKQCDSGANCSQGSSSFSSKNNNNEDNGNEKQINKRLINKISKKQKGWSGKMSFHLMKKRPRTVRLHQTTNSNLEARDSCEETMETLADATNPIAEDKGENVISHVNVDVIGSVADDESYGLGSDGKAKWVTKLISKEKPLVIGLQESKMDFMDENLIRYMWGSDAFGYSNVNVVGSSGGILTVWDNTWFFDTKAMGEEGLLAVCPLILNDKVIDFGPNPFLCFDILMEDMECERIVAECWRKIVYFRNPDSIFRDKLKNVKEGLKAWSKLKFGGNDRDIKSLRMKLLNGKL
ncbi:hypothetical protein Tco_0169949 [Tanacetum coccineum]